VSGWDSMCGFRSDHNTCLLFEACARLSSVRKEHSIITVGKFKMSIKFIGGGVPKKGKHRLDFVLCHFHSMFPQRTDLVTRQAFVLGFQTLFPFRKTISDTGFSMVHRHDVTHNSPFANHNRFAPRRYAKNSWSLSQGKFSYSAGVMFEVNCCATCIILVFNINRCSR